MSRSLDAWPALDGPPPAGLFSYEHGVWGKAHGAASDFRWLARSADFAPGDLARRFALGAEDRREKASFWLTLGERCYAGVVYPSRAMDAAGRQDTLEKQVLEWHRRASQPAALGALTLLPIAALLDDSIWWERRGDAGWLRADFAVPIPPHDLTHTAPSAEDTAAAIARGIAALSGLASEAALAELYAQLLSARRPAFLRGLPQPLPAEALAALLLPLPSAMANRLALAGWLPSSRLALDQLAAWDVVCLPPSPAVAAPPVIAGDLAHRAAILARALRANDPSLLALAPEAEVSDPGARPPFIATALGAQPGFSAPAAVASQAALARTPLFASPVRHATVAGVVTVADDNDLPLLSGPVLRLALTLPPPDAQPAIHLLHEFAAARHRRWLDPRAFSAVEPLDPGDPAAAVLLVWIEELSLRRGDADPDQWAVKIDLLRSAALTLMPATGRTAPTGARGTTGPIGAIGAIGAIGTIGTTGTVAAAAPVLRPATGRIPPLLFAAALGRRGYRVLQALPREELQLALAASLQCTTPSLARQVRDWLQEVRRETRWQALEPAIRAALTRHPPAADGSLGAAPPAP